MIVINEIISQVKITILYILICSVSKRDSINSANEKIIKLNIEPIKPKICAADKFLTILKNNININNNNNKHINTSIFAVLSDIFLDNSSKVKVAMQTEIISKENTIASIYFIFFIRSPIWN